MSQYNLRNPAVKRLMKEAEELYQATDEYHAQPLEDNLFEWHFSIRGPPNSDFEGGIYHGRITLPPDYPMKPPSIILLTPNGRFETNKKICLSISGYHPESWQPSWSIRTALLAIIGFMPTHGNGALGSLDYTPAERKLLALKSQEFKCPECGLVKDIFSKRTSSIKEDTTPEKTTIPESPSNNVPDLPPKNMELSTSDEESHTNSESEITQDSPDILGNEEKEDIKQSEEVREIGSKRKSDFCDSKSVKMKVADDANNLMMEVVDVEPKIEKDECYIYGKYVATQLKKYSSRTQIIVKHLINNILFQADMEEYNLNLPAANNPHCFFPTSAVQMRPNNTTQTQIYPPPVTQYSPMASYNSQIRNAIPTLFSNPNPLISELLRRNPGLPGLLAQNPKI